MMSHTAPFPCLVSFLSAFLVVACASTVPTPRSQAGAEAVREQSVSDARLERDVRLTLLDKLGEDALVVTVDARAGRVTLIGAVDERSTQELAEEVAKTVPGVRSIGNRLFVRKASGDRTTMRRAVGHAKREVDDAILEMRLGNNLLGEIGRYALDLEVEASDGVVSLRGTLPDAERRALALKVTWETSGVKQVVDLLKIR